MYHIRIIAKKNWFTRHETDRFLNNHCYECVRAYEASMIVYNFSSRGHDRKSSEQNNNGEDEDDKHAHGFADF